MNHAKSRILVSDHNFKSEVLDGSGPFVIDFSAEWCGPCRQASSTIDDIAGEFGEQVRFVTLDIDQSPRAARRYHVRSVPTMLFVNEGRVVDQTSGLRPRSELVAWIDRLLGLTGDQEGPPLKLAS